MGTTDDAFVMAGDTGGAYVTASNGGHDFVAIKINDSGTVLWQWQVSMENGSFEPFQATRTLWNQRAFDV